MTEEELREAIASVIDEASMTGWRRSRAYDDDEINEAVDEILAIVRAL